MAFSTSASQSRWRYLNFNMPLFFVPITHLMTSDSYTLQVTTNLFKLDFMLYLHQLEIWWTDNSLHLSFYFPSPSPSLLFISSFPLFPLPSSPLSIPSHSSILCCVGIVRPQASHGGHSSGDRMEGHRCVTRSISSHQRYVHIHAGYIHFPSYLSFWHTCSIMY